MSDLPRPGNRSDGSSVVKERQEENRRESLFAGGAGGGGHGCNRDDGTSAAVKPANDSGRSTPKPPGTGSSGGERVSPPVPLSPIIITNFSPIRGGINTGVTTSPHSLHRYQSRSPLFRRLSRSSSGYFSFDSTGDSVPGSPFLPPGGGVMEDKATQTPSPAGQVMTHALQRMSKWPGAGGAVPPGERSVPPGERSVSRDHSHLYGSPPSPALLALHSRDTAGDMQAEILIGQDLRHIGDQFNRLLMNRQQAGGQAPPDTPPPNIHREPAFLICMSLLLLLVGRVLYLQGIDGQPP